MDRSTSSSWTSPITPSTSRARSGSRRRSRQTRAPCCSSRTTARCWIVRRRQIVTLEGRAAWTHAGGFATYGEARDARVDRLDERHRRYEEERKRLAEMVKEMKRKAAYNDGWASRARAAEHRLERFVEREGRRRRPRCRTFGCGARRPHRQDRVPGRVVWRSRGSSIRSTPRSGSASASGSIGPNGRQVALPAAPRRGGDRP